MSYCRELAELVASWGGAVVPARVAADGGSWTKSSIRGWPSRATADVSAWRHDWFTWGGSWWAALCPRQGGLIALDCDGPEAVGRLRDAVRAGDVAWDREHPPLSYTTPGHGGGLHVVWRWPHELERFARRVATLPGGGQLDVRGEGTFLLLCGAPRPDLPAGVAYELRTRPGDTGPPPLPAGLLDWLAEQGPATVESAPSLDVRQMAPDAVARKAAEQGGRIHVDRHTALFALASYLRVRAGTNTFETLAAELWRVVEAQFDVQPEGEEHWSQECIRVAQNALKYTRERDEKQRAAAEALVAQWTKTSSPR